MRIWQTHFQIIGEMQSIPHPGEIVLERQTSPSYHIEESRRGSNAGGQIVCTLSGEGAFRCKNEITPLLPGVAFMARHGDPDIAYYYPGHAHEPWFFLWASFFGQQANVVLSELIERHGHIFHLPMDSGLIPFLKSFEAQRDTIQVITPIAGAKITFDILAAFGETVEEKIGTSPQVQLVKKAQELILSKLDRSMDIARIAEELRVTREHLTRVFRAQTGISPGQFALENRMRVAARLLLDQKLSCKEVAERFGYESASSFTRVFKSVFAVSPVKYKDSPVPPKSRRQNITLKKDPDFAAGILPDNIHEAFPVASPPVQYPGN